jgi:hypothetical protein
MEIILLHGKCNEQIRLIYPRTLQACLPVWSTGLAAALPGYLFPYEKNDEVVPKNFYCTILMKIHGFQLPNALNLCFKVILVSQGLSDLLP